MPNAADEESIQSRVAQLEVIAARRNELLGQMYHLMRQRHGLSFTTDESDDEEGGLQAFLEDFKLQKPGGNGYIEHHVERLLRTARDSPISSTITVKTSHTTKSRTPSQSRKSEPLDDNASDGGEAEAEGSDEDRDESDVLDCRSKSASGTDAIRSQSAKEEDAQKDRVAEVRESVKEEDEAMNLDARSPEPSELGYPESPVKSQVTKDTLSSPVSRPPQTSSMELLPSSSNAQTTETAGDATNQASAAHGEATSLPERPALKATPSEPCISSQSPARHQNSIVIPAPLEPSSSSDQFHNTAIAPLPPHGPASAPTSTSVLQFKMEYTLPHSSILPPEFNRKKTSKRKKDRSDKKGDDLPMGLNRWAATLNANPVYHRLRRSTKCLSTKDWTIAISELKLIRTIERIEKLKQEGRWSFRQTKKQRGVGGLMKTHWDYLMDEMKWMRTDFREERKWKLAIAYNLSTSVLEWHALGSWEERVARGVCVKWKPAQENEDMEDRHTYDDDDMEADQDNLDADGTTEPQESGRSSRLAVDYTSDDDDKEDDTESKDVVNPLNTADEIEGVINDEARARELEKAQAEIRETDMKNLKKEETDDSFNLRTGDSDHRMKAGAQVGTDSDFAGLKSTSKDPLLGSKSSSHSLNGDTEDSKSHLTKAKISAYAPIREKIVYDSSDKLFINPEDLEGFVHPDNSDNGEHDVMHALRLSTLFPELQPFGMLDVAPPVAVEPSKKRSSRSADKDDPNKRVDETNYTKVMPASRFMTVKPTLLGPLQPAKNFKDGKWLPMEEYAVPPDMESTGRITEESMCELFDFKVKTSKGDGLQARDARQPRNDQYWSTNDDLLLKQLIDRYPGNWNLIAECFNGARLTTPSDRRSAADCQERWRAKWSSDLQANRLQAHDTVPADEPDDTNATVTPSTSSTSMTTRGHKRLASTSSTQAPSIAAGSEPKKRRRHFLMQETIKKAGRKRLEQHQRNLALQRKPAAQMHDTHMQLHKLPKVTPADLSRQKAERDAAQMLEIQKARAKQEELTRQRLIPQAAAAIQAAQQQANQQQVVQQAPQQQQAQGGQATPIAPLTSAQVQHQLLLQQAAAAAQANQANQAGQGSQAQGNQVSRTGAANNVNITRISTPSAPPGVGGTRLTSQQILQLQAQQQQRTLSQQMVNGTTNGTGVVAGVNGNGATGSGNVVNREPTASPAQHGVNSPHLAGNVGANSPSPVPGAVVQAAMGGQTQGQQATTSRGGGNHYFNMNTATTQYTAEQLQVVRMQYMQQAAQRLQQEQNQ